MDYKPNDNLQSLYPILYLAQRLAIGKVTAAITLWSAAFSLLMLALRGYKGAMAIRFVDNHFWTRGADANADSYTASKAQQFLYVL